MSSYSRKLYRSRDGIFFGVCRGLANYAAISVFWLRVIAVVALIFTGFWPVLLLYIGAAIFMRPEPVFQSSHGLDEDLYSDYYCDRSASLRRIQRKFDSLERRTRNMESVVTDREYDWNRRFNSI
ncbi:MAG: envelope stress response membrane protein PspC [Verrucomicrobia bacterium]|nr:envelope stress response membrane protein PspC [Verrucomicrobiota bacterium]